MLPKNLSFNIFFITKHLPRLSVGKIFSFWMMIEKVVVQAVDAVVEGQGVVGVVVAGAGGHTSAPLPLPLRLRELPLSLPGFSLRK